MCILRRKSDNSYKPPFDAGVKYVKICKDTVNQQDNQKSMQKNRNNNRAINKMCMSNWNMHVLPQKSATLVLRFSFFINSITYELQCGVKPTVHLTHHFFGSNSHDERLCREEHKGKINICNFSS